MNPETTRPSLLSRVRDPADHAAWAEFESRYRDLVLRYCRRCGLQAADAEDVRQMVMLRLVRILPRFRYDPQHGRFHDYLYRVTRSAIADFRRCPESRAALVLEGDSLQAMLRATDAPDPTWEQEWLDHHLRMALATVRQTSDARSIAVFERLLDGAPVAQVAAEFAMTPEAVHKVKQRIRARVQQSIAKQVREEDEPNG